ATRKTNKDSIPSGSQSQIELLLSIIWKQRSRAKKPLRTAPNLRKRNTLELHFDNLINLPFYL
ncbi:hypothetical protein, partial [Streptococcus mutans]|uniref:hypothetical protein n=1 Tax=Streptococcus mutans TaxID=1309 RepID=UPI000516E02D